MIFYHYTPSNHIHEIRDAGVINTTESNLHHEIVHYGPDVVWLFKEPLGDKIPKMMKATRRFKDGSVIVVDKSQWEITVDLPPEEVIRADKFFKRFHSDDPSYADLLLNALELAGGSKAKTWYVIQRPIPSEEWVFTRERPHQNRITMNDGVTVSPREIIVEQTTPRTINPPPCKLG